MLSPKKLFFNDREWHDLSIQRFDTNITLQIDEHFVRYVLHYCLFHLNVITIFILIARRCRRDTPISIYISEFFLADWAISQRAT